MFANIRHLMASDVLLACLLPLFIAAVFWRFLPASASSELKELVWPSPIRKSRPYFSLERAYHSYTQYTKLADYELSRMRASYAKSSYVNKKLGYKIGYPQKLDRLQNTTQLNAVVANGIADLAKAEFPKLKSEPPVSTTSADLGRVREAMKHYVRDWSMDGRDERARIFAPILDVLATVPPKQRSRTSVLVPGSGLGRLAWEISQLGFNTTANELSYFMTLAFRFLASPETTTEPNQHVVRPYAHWFSHQVSNENLFRPTTFPDVVPRLSSNFRLLEQDFFTLSVPSEPEGAKDAPTSKGYDYIVTLFFIDTSPDFFTTLDQIHSLLRPGGTWINLGPLLWPSNAEAKVELSLEEVLHAVQEVGFILDTSQGKLTSQRTVECEYTTDKQAMMRWTYKAKFWVATKSK